MMTKMQKMLTWCITVVMLAVSLCFPLQASALTEGDWEFQLLDGEAMITGYNGPGGDVEIPEQLFGATVTEIEDVFSYNDSITSLDIPGTIKKIPEFFCWDASNLSSVTLHEGLEEIGASSFPCKDIEKIVLPSTLKVIGNNSFSGTSITSIDLHEGLISIGGEAFSKSALVQIDLSVLSPMCQLGKGIFYECTSLETVKWGSQAIIPEIMFSGCINLENISLTSYVEKIESRAFFGCLSMEKVILPISLRAIETDAFTGSGLRNVVIPYGVESISQSFRACPNLKSVYIPDTVDWLDHRIIDESPNCIIYCSSDSHAAKVCKEHKISYITDKSVNSLITVLYNDTRISFHTYDQNPELINHRTLVPLRSIFEAMGATVTWDAENRTAIATRKGITVKIQIGSDVMDKNGSSIPVDVPAQLINDRTMVPVRVIAEAFGADVEWNGNGRTVLINE